MSVKLYPHRVVKRTVSKLNIGTVYKTGPKNDQVEAITYGSAGEKKKRKDDLNDALRDSRQHS